MAQNYLFNPYTKPAYTGAGDIEAELAKYAQAHKAETEALLRRQRAEQEGLFRKYETMIGGQEKLGTAYSRLKEEAGLPEIRQQIDIFKGQIYKIKDLIDRLDEDISARTRGTFTTEAQRRRQIAAEQEPLQTQLGRLGTAVTPFLEREAAGMQEVGTRLGLLQQQQAKELQPIEARINTISDRFAREITGFTQAKETELDILIDKVQRHRELQDREWQRIQDLAREEREFARQKQLAAIEHRYAMREAAASRAYETSTAAREQRQAALGEIGQVITNFFKGAGGKKRFATERNLIPTLVAKYSPYGISRADITKMVYPFRKKYLGY